MQLASVPKLLTCSGFLAVRSRLPISAPFSCGLMLFLPTSSNHGVGSRFNFQLRMAHSQPFDISVQIRRTVRQPNDVRSGVLEQIAELCGELLVVVHDEESLAAQKAVERVGEIPTNLHHERAVRPGSDSGNVHFSRRQLDDDEHIVGHESADRGDLDGEEVGRSNGFPMGGEKREDAAPRGTTVIGYLRQPANLDELGRYLQDFVRYVPTAIYFNDQKVSQDKFSTVEGRENLTQIGSETDQWHDGDLTITGRLYEDRGHTVVASIDGLSLGGEAINLIGYLRFEGGPIDVFKRGFKLCPTTVGTTIGVTGRLDCDRFIPTAGRDSLV